MVTDNMDSLRARLHALPQELYDDIANLVLQGAICSIKTFPAQLHIDRKTRKHYLEQLVTCSDEIAAPFLKIRNKCFGHFMCGRVGDITVAFARRYHYFRELETSRRAGAGT